MPKPKLDDYIDVAERINAFKQVHPDGSLQRVDWQVTEVGGKTFVVYTARAYRTPDDERPGEGTAWEPFPGPTPYTKDSELMNAETAAWGRAIAALGFEVRKGIATKQDVRNRSEGRTEAPKPSNGRISDERASELWKLYEQSGVPAEKVGLWLVAHGTEDVDADSKDSLAKAISALPEPEAQLLEAKLREKVAA